MWVASRLESISFSSDFVPLFSVHHAAVFPFPVSYLISLSLCLSMSLSLSLSLSLHQPTVVTVFLSAVCSAWHSVWRMMAIPEGGCSLPAPHPTSTPNPPPIPSWPLLSPQPPHHYNEASAAQRRKRRSPHFASPFKEQG